MCLTLTQKQHRRSISNIRIPSPPPNSRRIDGPKIKNPIGPHVIGLDTGEIPDS